MTQLEPPFERFYDLNRLSEAGFETDIALDPADRAKLAEWADVDSVDRFEARVTLRRLSPTRFAYSAVLEADITQSCAVTLEPVSSSIVRDFTRELHLVPEITDAFAVGGELTATAGEDDVPEEIAGARYDLAAPLLEEFVLAIDPYPRAPGVDFEPPADKEDKPESPFAVLKTLRAKG